MLLGARTAAWAGGGKVPTIDDYYKVGIFSHFDAIDNTATGHSDSATGFYDHAVGSFVNFSGGTYAWASNYLTATAEWYLGALCRYRQDITTPYTGFADAGGFTHEAVVSIGTVPSTSTWNIISSGLNTSATGYIYFERLRTGDDRAVATSQDSSTYNQGYPLADIDHDELHTWTLSYDGVEYKIYLDGELVRTVPKSGTITSITNKVYNYMRISTSGNKNGAYRLYEGVLTAAQIAANYAIDKARFGLT